MNNHQILVAAGLVAISAGTATAQEKPALKAQKDWSWGGHLSGGYAFEGQEGGELEAAVSIQYKDWARLNLIPVNVVFYEDEDSPFYNDTFSNGQSRCRDSRNGQFADDSECAPAADYRAGAEALVLLNQNFGLGGGVLVGDEAMPFASAGVEFGKYFGLYVRGGDDYAAAQFRIIF
ncbi:MAG: hypothetical protein MRY64_13340 [Hyphomonadaceae bacterium]|nr:hypothetical protein [Hyphomonadaceae bacterium]